MGNQQPLNGGPPGGPQPGSDDDPRHHGHGAMPPSAYGAYGGAVGGGPGAGYPPGEQQQRRGSDASMTLLDAQKTAAAVAASGDGTLENWLDDDTVPTVFRWEHGGRQVYITGTFNGWSRQIPMHRSGNDFTYIHNLKRGKHAFKFIVDDEWRFAPDQPTVADIEGRINNFIDVTDFKAYTGDREFEREKAAAEYGYIGEDPDAADSEPQSEGSDTLPNRPDMDGEVFSHTMPDEDDYTKEPPPLPPHLRHIILNKPPQLQDTAALPVPQHVALNHLYCTAIKDNMMVLGITQRYKTKFVTTVYYSPCASK
jgi:5'-AMP-activated protein kinase regulatory beta subunit